jgi:riboflavin kinase/FMN adenylyltransferase
MKVYRSIRGIKKHGKKTAVTIGVFDGMHLGHRRLIEETAACARSCRGIPAVITFKQLPEIVLNAGRAAHAIKSAEEKIRRLGSAGARIVVMLDFKKIAGMMPEEFIKKVVVEKLRACCVVAGRDFVFGKGGSGNIKTLKELGKKYGFCVKVPRDYKINGRRISSTLIREYLKKGDVRTAERMLGGRYSVSGRVTRGRRLGFEFPTANIRLDIADIPARGVWAVEVNYNGRRYTGAANIGFAPTLKRLDKALLEVHIFDFHGNIYGREIEVVFLERLRDEKKFRDHAALLKQVEKDIEYIRKKYIGGR